MRFVAIKQTVVENLSTEAIALYNATFPLNNGQPNIPEGKVINLENLIGEVNVVDGFLNRLRQEGNNELRKRAISRIQTYVAADRAENIVNSTKRIYFTGHSYGGMMCHLLLEKLIDNVKKDTTLNPQQFNESIMRIFQTVKIVTFGSIYITSYFIGNYGNIMNDFNRNGEGTQGAGNNTLGNFITEYAGRHGNAEVPNLVDRNILGRRDNRNHYLPHNRIMKQRAIVYARGRAAKHPKQTKQPEQTEQPKQTEPRADRAQEADQAAQSSHSSHRRSSPSPEQT